MGSGPECTVRTALPFRKSHAVFVKSPDVHKSDSGLNHAELCGATLSLQARRVREGLEGDERGEGVAKMRLVGIASARHPDGIIVSLDVACCMLHIAHCTLHVVQRR